MARKRYIKWIRNTLLLFIVLLSITAWWILHTKEPRKGGRVEIRKLDDGYKLYKDGKPFFVKGGAGYTQMKELAVAGGNTIRTWDTVRLGEILDEAARHNLSVIAGFYLPESSQIDEFYDDSSKTAPTLRAYMNLVRKYKNHPALLAWCLGNELSFSLHPYKSPFYKFMNRLLDDVHEEDKDHPVTTTIIERSNLTGIKIRIPDFDFISINTFANTKKLKKNLSGISWFWKGPYLITEWAPVGGWEAETTAWHAPIENTSTKTAEQVSEYYKNHLPFDDGRMLGSLIFFWGTKEEFTHTWFSIFHENGNPTEVYETVKDCWKDTITPHLSPQIEYLLVNNKGARDNILVTAGTQIVADLIQKKKVDTTGFHYHWELLKEDWIGPLIKNNVKPDPEYLIVNDSTTSQIQFRSPTQEGPYRIFVTVSNQQGYSATANIPFYVVKP